MDALRLLTAGTRLKTVTIVSQEPLPSKGWQTPSTSLGKRKREEEGAELPSPDTWPGILKKQKIKIVELRPQNHEQKLSRVTPCPLTSFSQLRDAYSISSTLYNNILKQGYSEPTDVQLATIPLQLEPRLDLAVHSWPTNSDLLTVAQTGSGKTLAFLIPLIESIHQRHNTNDGSGRHTTGIILAPTKELVAQIVNEGRKLIARTNVTITVMRKGMKVGSTRARDEMAIKSDIIVSTPLLIGNALSESDNADAAIISNLILDEADVLLDPLFRDQTLSVWQSCSNPNLRLSMWSATMGSNIEELAMATLAEHRKRTKAPATPLLRCVVGLKDSAIPTVAHKMIYAGTEPGKLLALRQLLRPTSTNDGRPATSPLRPPFLVFTQTIERASALHTELLYDIPAEAGGSSRIAVLHAELSDTKRSDVMARFRRGEIWVLITTDLLSRGIDFRGVNGVVNYDIPTSSASYVHRAGRTGRAGREGGVAVTLYTKDDVKYVKMIANVIAASEKNRKEATKGDSDVRSTHEGLPEWLLHALPDVSKKDRAQLKKGGVEVRKKMKEGEDDKVARQKRKARITTKSGYERKLDNRKKGAKEGSRRRAEEEVGDSDGDEWDGLE